MKGNVEIAALILASGIVVANSLPQTVKLQFRPQLYPLELKVLPND